MEYAFNVGDRVKYTNYSHTEKICPECGHEDYELTTEPAEGVIEKRMYDFVYNTLNGFVDTSASRNESGMNMIVPKMAPVELQKQQPVYAVGGVWRTEDALEHI